MLSSTDHICLSDFIKNRTPPYRSFDIDTEVEVQVQLERPSDSATSASLPFIYKPIERCACDKHLPLKHIVLFFVMFFLFEEIRV